MNPDFFIKLLELRDAYTKGHSERGVLFAIEIGKELALTERELEFLKIGGSIHDIGKVAIPDVILLKPGRLTPKEYEIMKLHVQLGYELVKDLYLPRESVEILLYHQERYDGKGYPFGKKGNEIPLLARIYTIADSFEAMTARRIYKKSKLWKEALKELEELAGTHFDPDIVPYAIRALSKLEGKVVSREDIDTELEKIRWTFYYLDPTGAIKGDLFLSTLQAYIDRGLPFCFTMFDVKNLFSINQRYGWEKGNEILTELVNAINIQCCATHDIRDLILKLMRMDILDITTPVIFRLGGDEFGVIAPYIPPPEKAAGVVKYIKEKGAEVVYRQMKFPEDFSSTEEVLSVIMEFSKKLPKVKTYL